MKKTLITSVMLAAALFAFSAVNATPAKAVCPAKQDCAQEKQMPLHHPEPCMKPMPPEEHAKLMEAKKAEFEERLKLTEEQKAKIEELKASEQKSLKSCRAKIEKEKAKLDKLIAQELEVKKQNFEKFEAILTEDQKAEIKKMHEEMMAEKAKFVPCSCDCGCPECAKHHEEAKAGHHGPQGPEFGPGPKGPHHGSALKNPETPQDVEPAPAEEASAPVASEADTPAAPAANEAK